MWGKEQGIKILMSEIRTTPLETNLQVDQQRTALKDLHPNKGTCYIVNDPPPRRKGLTAMKDLQASSQSFDSDHANCPAELLSDERRRRKSVEMFWRRGSKILPDFFPPNAAKRRTLSRPIKRPVNKFIVVRQYSWEKLGNEQSEVKTIAESWLVYFGMEDFALQ